MASNGFTPTTHPVPSTVEVRVRRVKNEGEGQSLGWFHVRDLPDWIEWLRAQQKRIAGDSSDAQTALSVAVCAGGASAYVELVIG